MKSRSYQKILNLIFVCALFASCKQSENNKNIFEVLCKQKENLDFTSYTANYDEHDMSLLNNWSEKEKKDPYSVIDNVPMCLTPFKNNILDKYIISTNNERYFLINKKTTDTSFSLFDDKDCQYIYSSNCDIKMIYNKKTNLFFCSNKDPLCGMGGSLEFDILIDGAGQFIIDIDRSRKINILMLKKENKWYKYELPRVVYHEEFISTQKLFAKICNEPKKKQVPCEQFDIVNFLFEQHGWW